MNAVQVAVRNGEVPSFVHEGRRVYCQEFYVNHSDRLAGPSLLMERLEGLKKEARELPGAKAVYFSTRGAPFARTNVHMIVSVSAITDTGIFFVDSDGNWNEYLSRK